MKETFARNKVLSLLVLILLLTNILLVVFFVYMKHDAPVETGRKDDRGPGRGVGDVEQILQKQVGFSEDQMAHYKDLKDRHWERIKPLFGEMRIAKDKFYGMIDHSIETDSSVVAVADSIAFKQKQLDLATFRHFRQVRDLCTPDQRPAFDSLVHDAVIRRMTGPWRKNPKDNKEDSTKLKQ